MLEAGTLLGNYKILGQLGSGGMADVYRAEDQTLGRIVALKVLPPEFGRNPQLVARFEKEVRSSASLNHAGIVTVFEVGRAEGVHYYSMRLLTGGDLRGRIERGMTEIESLSILREITDAFVHAHGAGFVHRDVKPENILFDEQGRPVLTDFGIAKIMSSESKMTATGVSIGTPRYISPEQARGRPVDARADIYSLGVILYEMLTGHPPYDAEESLAVIFKHVTEPIPRLPEAVAKYQPLIDSLMAKEPAQRPASSTELLHLIDELLPPQRTATMSQYSTAAFGVVRSPTTGNSLPTVVTDGGLADRVADEARRAQEDQARKQREEDERKQQEALAKQKAEDDAHRRAAEEAERQRRADEERQRQEALARQKAEEAERRRLAEEQARVRAEEERLRQQELARQKAEEDARRKAAAEEAARVRTEQERVARIERERIAAEEAERKRIAAEELRARREEEQRIKAEQAAAQKAEKERLAREAEARKQAERERKVAEADEARRRKNEEKQQKAVADAARRAEQEAAAQQLALTKEKERQEQLARKRELAAARGESPASASKLPLIGALIAIILGIAVIVWWLKRPASTDGTVEATPTALPSAAPTAEASAEATARPTTRPTATPAPSAEPTAEPTAQPTTAPTAAPTAVPTAAPTSKPVPTSDAAEIQRKKIAEERERQRRADEEAKQRRDREAAAEAQAKRKAQEEAAAREAERQRTLREEAAAAAAATPEPTSTPGRLNRPLGF